MKLVALLLFVAVCAAGYYMYFHKAKSLTSDPGVDDSSSTDMTLYYHPQCGHCMEFKPTWEEFQNGRPSAKMIDCSKQECPGIRGFPTVIGKSSSNEVTEYSGNRSLESLVTFENSLK